MWLGDLFTGVTIPFHSSLFPAFGRNRTKYQHKQLPVTEVVLPPPTAESAQVQVQTLPMSETHRPNSSKSWSSLPKRQVIARDLGPFITSVATFRALYCRREREETLCVHGADAVPGDGQTPIALDTMRRKVLVHRETWRKGSKRRGHVTVYQHQIPAGVRGDDEDKFALCHHKAPALAGENNEAPEVDLTTVPAPSGACKWSSGAGERPAKLQRTMTHYIHAPLSSMTMRAHHCRYVIMSVIDGRSCCMASGDGFRLFMAGLLPQYSESVINRDTFNKILGTICEEVNGGIQSQLKQQYDSTRELGWTEPFVSVQMDLTTTHDVEYLTMSVSFVPPNWNASVADRIVQHEQGPNWQTQA